MRPGRLACALVACALVACILGASLSAQAPQASPSSASASVATPPDYVIGPEDVLQIMFWRDEQLSSQVLVRPDGKITLPLLNEIHAAGLTPEQLRGELVELARRYIEEPTATVIVKEIHSRKVFIMGEVAKPGPYPLGGPTTILQLIAMAGGLNEFAASDQIVVVRSIGGRPTRHRFNYKAVVKGKNLQQNLELKAGDTVIVP